jgi:hypothetical protein
VSQFGAMANEQRWKSFVNDFVAKNSEILEILESDPNFTLTIVNLVRGQCQQQGIHPPSDDEITEYCRSIRPPAAVAIGPAQHNDKVSTPSSLGSESNGAIQRNRGRGPAEVVAALDTAPRDHWDEMSSIGNEAYMGSVASFSVSGVGSLDQSALERNDGNGAPVGRFGLEQNAHDHANLNPDDGDSSVGRFNLAPLTKCTHG